MSSVHETVHVAPRERAKPSKLLWQYNQRFQMKDWACCSIHNISNRYIIIINSGKFLGRGKILIFKLTTTWLI